MPKSKTDRPLSPYQLYFKSVSTSPTFVKFAAEHDLKGPRFGIRAKIIAQFWNKGDSVPVDKITMDALNKKMEALA